ncbi:MAG: YtxH domain-containing protein [Candidatus Dojkabacteria bacterium]|nr:MAG: YtxH domain-containing protein [Candidatus Dojkabacteria bacterium]
MGKNAGATFLKGALVGAVAGATAGILFAPKSGKETREDIKKAAAKLSKEAQEFYVNARTMLEKKMKALEKLGKSIDKEKYMALVEEVMAELKKNKTIDPKVASEVGQQLGADWTKLQKALKA